ncbi:MAG: ATP-dependent ligase, partial [Frankiales bacterium]|nr:ATP-dependent ligase [Frankiales bacterium]
LVDVEGRTLKLTNLEKVLYPSGFTKGQVIDYYSRIAPVLLPHLAQRALTRKRYPNGTQGPMFFEKNRPQGTPPWVRTVTLPAPGSTKNRDTIDYVVIEDLAGLVWTANLAALELHTHQWKVGRKTPDLLVFDLDPGPPATIVECCQVAMLLRDTLDLELFPKTSGNKGMQLVARAPVRDTSEFAREVAEKLETAHPSLVVSRMTKAVRPGKVFVDWSQNNGAKTTVTVYSLRARDEPTVSTPLTWEEVESCTSASDLVFRAEDVLFRVEELGDLFEPLL